MVLSAERGNIGYRSVDLYPQALSEREVIKGKHRRYRSADLDLGSVQENHDKVKEREMDCSLAWSSARSCHSF